MVVLLLSINYNYFQRFYFFFEKSGNKYITSMFLRKINVSSHCYKGIFIDQNIYVHIILKNNIFYFMITNLNLNYDIRSKNRL